MARSVGVFGYDGFVEFNTQAGRLRQVKVPIGYRWSARNCLLDPRICEIIKAFVDLEVGQGEA